MEIVNQYRKAVAGLLVPALLVIIAGLHGDSDGGSTITTAEWLTALVASLGTSGTVAVTRNTTHKPSVAATQSVTLVG